MHPAFFISHLAPTSRTVRAHAGRPSAALDGRSAIVQAGQCLGGGGSVNCASSLSLTFSLGSFLGKKAATLMAEARMDCVGVHSHDVHARERLGLR